MKLIPWLKDLSHFGSTPHFHTMTRRCETIATCARCSIPSTSIIHWNSQGTANKKADLFYLISKEKPDVVGIQETVLSSQSNFSLMYYNRLYNEGHANYWAQRGVAFFIHKTIPYQNLTLNTPLIVITARFSLGRDVITVCIYKSRLHAEIEKVLSILFQAPATT